MDKKRNYAVLGIGFVFACLIAPVISLTLVGPYIGGMLPIYPNNCCHSKDPVRYPQMHMSCPLILSGNKVKTATVSITNPTEYDDDIDSVYEYFIEVEAAGVSQGEYHTSVACSGSLEIIPPQQTGSFTCELNPKSLGGPVMWLYARGRVGNRDYWHMMDSCGVQPLNWLYFLLPVVVAAPFIWLHSRVNKGVQSS